MARTLCRCMTYYRIQSAVRLAASKMAGKRAGATPVVVEEVVA
jgi:hypothetical protein